MPHRDFSTREPHTRSDVLVQQRARNPCDGDRPSRHGGAGECRHLGARLRWDHDVRHAKMAEIFGHDDDEIAAFRCLEVLEDHYRFASSQVVGLLVASTGKSYPVATDHNGASKSVKSAPGTVDVPTS